MAKNKKYQQNYGATRTGINFLSSPTGKGIVAAGVVALAGLFLSKDKRAQGARDSLRGAADRMRDKMGGTFGSTSATRSQASGDGFSAH